MGEVEYMLLFEVMHIRGLRQIYPPVDLSFYSMYLSYSRAARLYSVFAYHVSFLWGWGQKCIFHMNIA